MLSISGLSPAEGAKQIEVNTDIQFTIIDDGNGIDTTSLIVNVLGDRAVTGVSFASGWNGPGSDITFSGNDLNVAIDPESNFEREKVVGIQIQVKNLSGDYFNYTYSFKTVPEVPVLVTSSPKDDEVITQPQYVYLEFEDIFDGIDKSTINVDISGVNYVINGVLQTELLGFLSEIRDSDSGDGAIVRIDPEEPFRNGQYVLNYRVADTSGNTLIDKIDFSVNQAQPTLPPAFPQTGFVGWFQGVKKVSDVGDGNSVDISWHQLATRSYQSEAFALVYQNEKRLDIFDGDPQYIAAPDLEEACIPGLTTGTTYSFAVRAMESYLDTVDLTGMEVVDSNGLYRVPEPVTIVSPVQTSDNIIYVDSVSGYPTAGFLIIGREIIRYNGLLPTENAFLVSPNGRGVSETTPGIYLAGDEIKLFLQCTDSNTAIVMSTPTYHDGYGFDRERNGIGLVVTDYDDNDSKYTIPYDFCGYHRAEPYNVLNGVDDCGSYQGGEFGGFRGMNLFDRLVAREEVLLNSTGEPVILLKRIWNGQTCSCMDSRRTHPKVKSCGECYGTGYVGGYAQYVNRRRGDQLVMLAFGDTTEDLKLGDHQSLEQDTEPSAWTIPLPAIRDRDLIVRFDFTGDVEYIYEVLNVTKEKAIFRHFTRQRLALKRMDKTDIIYTLPYSLPSNIGSP